MCLHEQRESKITRHLVVNGNVKKSLTAEMVAVPVKSQVQLLWVEQKVQI